MWLELAMTPHRIGYVDAGGIRTRFLEAGGGEAVIFLHGSGGYLEAYLRNVAAHAKHFHVFAIDMLGHGFSDKPDHPYEVRHYVEHLRAFCDALGLDRVHLSGESLGGWVAARFASTYPERVLKLVLNTAAGVHYDPVASARIRDISMNAAVTPSRDNIRSRLEWLVCDSQRVTDEMVDLRLRVYSQAGFSQAMAHIMSLHTSEYRLPNLLTEAEMATVCAPTLVLWTLPGSDNSVAIGEKLASMIPGAQLVVMDNCCHWPQFEDAERFNRIHIDFLQA
jgi:2-hydroxy-6-oxonona-2,4-dienedioate hydrolase